MNPTKSKISLIALLISSILVSCESENSILETDPEFSIKFSEGTIIEEKDIAFYDSSTCILFLNKELDLIVGTEKPTYSFTEFSTLVNEDTIYSGIVYPTNIFNGIRELFIYSNSYPTLKSDMLPIYCNYNNKDTLNDPRIIEALDKSNLLYKGISCSIDSVKKSPDNDSTLIFTITFTNHDPVNYYIPDPEKMGVMNFNVIVNIDFLLDRESFEQWYASANWDNFKWNIEMDDLSVLKSNGRLSYTYTSTYRTKTIKTGLYEYHLSVRTTSFSMESISLKIPLKQEDGRIWQGYYLSGLKSITIQ